MMFLRCFSVILAAISLAAFEESSYAADQIRAVFADESDAIDCAELLARLARKKPASEKPPSQPKSTGDADEQNEPPRLIASAGKNMARLSTEGLIAARALALLTSLQDSSQSLNPRSAAVGLAAIRVWSGSSDLSAIVAQAVRRRIASHGSESVKIFEMKLLATLEKLGFAPIPSTSMGLTPDATRLLMSNMQKYGAAILDEDLKAAGDDSAQQDRSDDRDQRRENDDRKATSARSADYRAIKAARQVPAQRRPTKRDCDADDSLLDTQIILEVERHVERTLTCAEKKLLLSQFRAGQSLDSMLRAFRKTQGDSTLDGRGASSPLKKSEIAL